MMMILVGWRLGFYDPTVVGWMVTIAYLIVAVFCCSAARSGSIHQKAARVVWVLLSVALLALGLNQQLDLQCLLRELVRGAWGMQPWYSDRWKIYGGMFALAIVVVGIAAVILLRRLPQSVRSLRWAIACFGLLMVGLLARFLPFWGLSDLMQYSLIEDEPSIWYLTPVQGFEFVLVILIGICAYVTTQQRVSVYAASDGHRES